MKQNTSVKFHSQNFIGLPVVAREPNMTVPKGTDPGLHPTSLGSLGVHTSTVVVSLLVCGFLQGFLGREKRKKGKLAACRCHAWRVTRLALGLIFGFRHQCKASA